MQALAAGSIYDLFVEGITPGDRRRDGSRGAGGSGLPNGASGISLASGDLCRLVSTTYKVGFRRARVRG